MRQPSVIKVETRAIRRIDLRMFALCELSLRSLSKALSIDTPVRSMSIGCVWLGRSRSIAVNGRGSARSAGIFCVNSTNCFPFGQLTVEQQVSDFFKTRLLRHVMNVVATVHQPRIGIDPTNGRLACDHAR